MRTTTLLLAAGALLISPTAIMAQHGHSGMPHGAANMGRMPGGPAMGASINPMSSGHHVPSPTTAPGNGQFQAKGYVHSNTGKAKGQPNQSCEELGTTPGRSASAPGGGSPFSGEDSKSSTHYAGSQLQNSRNTASVSQYDTACANQPH